LTIKVYGNGLAKGNVTFLNGLIQYNGFYLNTDGQLSADQFLQANSKYHNYAYVIQSQHSIVDYGNTLDKIAHPAGMEILNEMLIIDNQKNMPLTVSNVTKSYAYTGTVTANAFNSNGNVVGFSTTFTAANVGDLIIIDSTDSGRQQTKIIKYIANDNFLTMESNTMFFGNGAILITPSSNVVNVTANIYDSVVVNDTISFEYNGSILNGKVLAISASSTDLTVNVANTVFVDDSYQIDSFSLLAGNNVITTTNSNTSGLVYGTHVYGNANIPPGTYITGVTYANTGTLVQISNPVTATLTGVTLNFNDHGAYYVLPYLDNVSYTIINNLY
jgi:hypothetical protein